MATRRRPRNCSWQRARRVGGGRASAMRLWALPEEDTTKCCAGIELYIRVCLHGRSAPLPTFRAADQ